MPKKKKETKQIDDAYLIQCQETMPDLFWDSDLALSSPARLFAVMEVLDECSDLINDHLTEIGFMVNRAYPDIDPDIRH